MPQPLDITPLTRLLRRIDDVADGAPPVDTIALGFPSLDELLGGGVRRGDLVVLGGDVASGKSALALGAAVRAAEQRTAVRIVTGEMSADRAMERALAIEGRVAVDQLRRGALDDEGRAGIGAAALRLRDAPLVFSTMPGGGAEALADLLRCHPDLDLAVVDPLESAAPAGLPRSEGVAAAARELKRLALELGVAVLATTALPHFARAGRADPRPTLDDFGGLGAVAQHADAVLAVFREEMYAGPQHGVDGATELLVLKNRGGPTGYADLYFYKQWMRFEDMLDPDR